MDETAEIVYAIRCFKDGERKLTHELTKHEAVCFRHAASHLVEYLTTQYKLHEEKEKAMTIAEDGGPAFPVEMPREIAAAEYKDGVITATVRGHPGMTLRDWLVGQSIVGLNNNDWPSVEWIVDHAEAIADEYLRRRAERAKGDKP